ncbi:MAG: hypothetical protein RLZZ564_589 [Pseudomonadota bacterium]|jgi:hypothetical protein
MKSYKEIFNSPRNFNSDKWEHYFDIYDHLLGRFYDSKINYLEIGVQNGGSLEIAKKLFSPESLIIGMDIDPNCKHLEGKVANQIIIGSQIDGSVLSKLSSLAPLDVIIDDGSHIQSHMIITFFNLFPLLSQNGVYIIEDTHTNYSPEHQESFLGIGLYDYFKGLSERLNIDFMNPYFRKERYKLPINERPLVNQIPDIVRDIFSIEFFDSVIAIKKRTKIEPLRIRR